MTNERVLNIKIPDKLYFALKKAAEQKSISLAALTRMICSDWIMEQNTTAKSVFTYPESLLDGLNQSERLLVFDTVADGGYTYNRHGEACFDANDDGDDDDAYEQLCTPEESAESIKQMKEGRIKK